MKTSKKETKTNIIRKNIVAELKPAAPFALSSIAVLAIIWFILASYDAFHASWALPLVVTATSLGTLIVPLMLKRFKVVNSLIAVGMATLFLYIKELLAITYCWSEYFNNFSSVLIIFIVGIITELLIIDTMGLLNIMFDVLMLSIMSFMYAFLNTFAHTNLIGISTILWLFAYYILIILINSAFTFKLSFYVIRNDSKKDSKIDINEIAQKDAQK